MFGANNYLPIFFSLDPIREGRPVSMGGETGEFATLISRRESTGDKKWPTRKFFFVHANWRRRRQAGRH